MMGSTLHLACQTPPLCSRNLARAVHTICDDDGVVSLDGLVHDGFREVNGEEDGVHVSSERIEGRLE